MLYAAVPQKPQHIVYFYFFKKRLYVVVLGEKKSKINCMLRFPKIAGYSALLCCGLKPQHLK